MNVAQIITYVSSDGAYGGPVQVMRSQAQELAHRGHTVTVLAGWDGHAEIIDRQKGITPLGRSTVSLCHKHRFGTMTSPSLAATAWRLRHEFDVVHVHVARDFVSLPAAFASRGPALVLQPHGMIIPDSRLPTRALDAALTRRTLRRASAVLALTAREAAQLTEVSNGAARVVRIPNGAPTVHATVTQVPHRGGRPVVAFCARLHPRKRVQAFVDAAVALHNGGVNADFVIAGPDGGDLPELQARLTALGSPPWLSYIGSLAPDAVPGFLASATVFVLPSVDEPFPITVLQAMQQNAAVVITETCGIADTLAAAGAAAITDGSVGSLCSAISMLLADDGAREQRITNAASALASHFSMRTVGDILEAVYEQALNEHR